MDPTARFSGRVQAYTAARPGYPRALLDVLAIPPDATVADLGSGTGIFTRLLLESGAHVFAVEPNEQMRAAAEAALGKHPRFHSVGGRAEETTLPDASIDVATAAQAFHWFDLERTRVELRRILRPGGRVALVWNDRDTDGTPFLRAYEAILLAHCPGYRELQGKSDRPADFDALFGPGGWTRHVLPNEQRLDREGLLLRVMSASYAPREGTPAYDALKEALDAAYEAHAEEGGVRVLYACVVVMGSLPME